MAVLGYLARQPAGAATLSEIAAAAQINKATCLSILATLTEHDVLVRNESSKRYSLGSALTSLGFAANLKFRGFAAARQEMLRLSTLLGYSCLVCAREGEEMVVLDMAGEYAPAHLPTRIGRRIPIEPPLGTVFYAWAKAEDAHRWLQHVTSGDPSELDRQVRALATVRSRGYSLGGERDLDVKLEEILDRLLRVDAEPRMLQVAMEVSELFRASSPISQPSDDPNFIIAPIFDVDGQPTMALSLFGQPGELRRELVPDLAADLLRAAERVSATLDSVTKVYAP